MALSLEGLARLVGKGDKTPNPPGTATAKGAVDTLTDPEGLAKGMAELRSLLRRTATAIGGVATAVVAGLGYTQLHEVFPVPRTVPDWVSWALLPACVAAAIAGSAWLAGRFFKAQRQILIAADLKVIEGLNDRDEQLAQSVLDEHAAEEGAKSLPDVELRSLRLGRIGRSSGTRREAAKKESDRLDKAVAIALDRAAATILEDRTRDAFQSWKTAAALALAAAGIVGTFAIADYSKGERSLSELRAACAKAEAENVPDACAPFESATQRRERSVAAAAAKAAATVEKAQTQTTPTAAQKAVLARVALCTREVNRNEALRSLGAVVKAQAIVLCAAPE